MYIHVKVQRLPKLSYDTTTWYGLRNVTSLVTSITQFVDTAVTNYHNTTFVANTSYLSSYDVASAEIPVRNHASGRQTVVVTEVNGTAVTTAATTVQSPQAFYLFSTIKVINVPAVTDKDESASQTSAPSAPLSVPSYTVISFSTPFIYLPIRGAKEGIDGEAQVWLGDNYHENTDVAKRALAPAATLSLPTDGAPEDFGYVPQALIDWMVKNPDYAGQYPGLASCLPGGPSIKPNDACKASAAPATLAPVPDLTINTAVTVQGEGCFHPSACPTPKADTNNNAEPAASPTGNTVEPTSTARPGQCRIFSGFPGYHNSTRPYPPTRYRSNHDLHNPTCTPTSTPASSSAAASPI
ncbi:MAG: hypothetical protein Q9222_007542 [Ikaeria aurantiellina]